ncbi:MAG TPA: 16S rRNA (adenine(1518)-N(6)/adenine(1519)-N(6))-dimethyltransferase RsmA [Tepidisphaeraceae bacterium]|jgi:16S rRNA (adenine1518-N6/adenine1519-N6)-dimethyltransferase|nr:16S rRNA (adenine(1518)-N(6)/adenine(1519)-N(6))-dimethyltransferase RsmA [Tepidisphaeraceae bacterium]
MPQSKKEIQDLLAGADTSPRHRFGQNFMIDQNLVRLIADAGQPSAEDFIIEVGPGTGTLTDELLSRGAAVTAVEIDRDLAGLLRQRFAENSKFHLIEGDALASKHAVNSELAAALNDAMSRGQHAKLIANLPYNIASPLVVELLIAGVELLAFTVQKEVADRFRAAAGGEDYGPLTVVTQLLGEVEVLRTLPPQAFWPAPKIDSSLVRIVRRDRLGERAKAFSPFLTQLFSARRKTIRKALANAGYEEAAQVLARLAIDPQARPEVLSPEQILALFDALQPPK